MKTEFGTKVYVYGPLCHAQQVVGWAERAPAVTIVAQDGRNGKVCVLLLDSKRKAWVHVRQLTLRITKKKESGCYAV